MEYSFCMGGGEQMRKEESDVVLRPSVNWQDSIEIFLE